MLDISQTAEYRKSTASKKRKEQPISAWGLVRPKDYLATYPALPPVPKAEPHPHLFGNGAAGHNVPLISRRGLEMFPGVYSTDATFLGFLRKLSLELNAAFPVDTDNDGFTATGIHTTFDRLRCPAGWFQNPMSYTTVDNATYREELGLTPGYSARQKTIAENVWKIVCKEAVVASVNVPKLSTGGMRRFTHDVQWKLAFVEWLLDGNGMDRFERYLNAVDEGDWHTLANEFETVFATYIQKRGQVDSPDKVRKVFDLSYAVSGGEKGMILDADKRVQIDGVDYPDFSAIRARVVHAGPWVINCYLQMLATPLMRSLFARFPSTFHVNTKEEILTQVQGKHVMCSDVTEYDRSMSKDAIYIPHQVMKDYVDERVVKASWRLFTSPYYSKPLEIGGKKGVWVRDPTDWGSEVFAGNRSGHAFTSLMAKVNKVIETLFIIDKIYPVVGRENDFLSGVMPMGMVNNGDDEIVWAVNQGDMDRFKQLRADLSLGHYVVTPEVGQGFSGLLLVRKGATTYEPSPRLQTPFEKMWVHERAIGGLHRQYWPIGFTVRIDTLMETENGRRAWEIHNRLYRDMMEPKYGSFIDALVAAVADMEFDMAALTHKDKEVITSPDKLHHKYTSDEISPTVLDKVTSKIPEEEVARYLKRYYKGNIK